MFSDEKLKSAPKQHSWVTQESVFRSSSSRRYHSKVGGFFYFGGPSGREKADTRRGRKCVI